MPRFTLQQLLVGVLVGCVYLAVTRDSFIEDSHAAVAITAWVILTLLYLRMRWGLAIVFHVVIPLAIMAAVLLHMLLQFSTNSWSQCFEVVAFTCRVSALVALPLAIADLTMRYWDKSLSPP
jgi:hypothetical protein